jgi:1-acyl-sn-glycerol-3-phosphate acyltransferase
MLPESSISRAAVYPGERLEHPAWKWVVLGVQLGLYPALMLVRWVLVRRGLVRSGRLAAAPGRSHVLYANHQSRLDPFLVCVALPPKTVLALLPFRLFVANSYFRNPMGAWLLALAGGFPAQAHPTRPYGLRHARQMLAMGQTVVIFPQGKRTLERVARPGIAALAREPEARLVPVRLEWRGRLTCRVHVGQGFGGAGTEQPDELMERVYRLG